MKARPAVFFFNLLLVISCATPPALSQEPTGYEPLTKGMQYFKENNYEKALEEFFIASIEFPDDPDMPYFIGLTFIKLKDNETAAQYFSSALEIDPSHTEANFELGALLVQREAYQEAIKHLETVYEKVPEKEDLGYLLGLAYYHLGQYERALHFFEVGKTTDKTIQSLTLYYTALTKQQLGLTKETRLKMKEVITFDPTSPVAPLSKKFIEILEIEERIKKRLHLEFTMKAGYDDNVLLVPTENVFNLREKGQDSFFETTFLSAEYVPFRRPRWEVSTSYSFNETLYNSIRKLDIQSHAISLESLWRGRLGPLSYELRPGYTFDYFLVNYHWFLSRHSFRIPYLLGESPRNMTVFSYDFHIKDFKLREPARFAAEDRDASNHELGFTHFFHTTDWKHYIKTGYSREWELAEGDNWDYWANRFLVGLQVTAPFNVKLHTDIIWQKDNYDHMNTFFDKRREDTDRVFSNTISRDITEHLNLFANYTRRRTTSNIQLFDIEKNIFSFGITFKY